MNRVCLYIDEAFEPSGFSTSSISLESSACRCTRHMDQWPMHIMFSLDMNHMLAFAKPSLPPHLVTMTCLGYALAFFWCDLCISSSSMILNNLWFHPDLAKGSCHMLQLTLIATAIWQCLDLGHFLLHSLRGSGQLVVEVVVGLGAGLVLILFEHTSMGSSSGSSSKVTGSSSSSPLGTSMPTVCFS